MSATTFEEWAQAAATAREAHDVSTAITDYSAAVELNPTWIEGWWYLGTFLFGSKQFAQAEHAFSQFVSLTPDSAPGWAFKSLSEIQTGAYEASLADMNRSQELGIGSQREIADVLKTNRALLLSRLGHYEQALRLLAVFTAAGPDPNLTRALGIAGLRRPLLPSEIQPSESSLFEDAGTALYLMLTGHMDEAGAKFTRLGSQYPTTAGVHYLIGYYLFGINTQAAAPEFERELQIAPKNAEAIAMLAYAKLLNGDRTSAMNLAQSAVRLDGEAPDPEYVLGRVLLEANKLPEAVAALEKSVQLDPNNLESRIELATAYVKAGRYQDGKRERQEALRVSTEGPGF